MKRFSATLVLIYGNLGKLREVITHDYPSTIVGRKKLERGWVQIIEDLDF